jgi:hypothetical protein
VAEVLQTDEEPDPEEPGDERDHIMGYSPRFIATHSDASTGWNAADFD